MPTTTGSRQAWELLRSQWHQTNNDARTSRALVTQAYLDCVQHRGSGPTLFELAHADVLEHAADSISMELDTLTRKGWANTVP